MRERRDDVSREVEDLEAEVDQPESEDFGEVLALHTEANQLEFALERLESDREAVEDEIESIEERVREADGSREKREGLVEELTDLRTRVDRIAALADYFADYVEFLVLLSFPRTPGRSMPTTIESG